MTTQEFKAALIQEHKRDLRGMFINFFIWTILILGFIYLIFFLTKDSEYSRQAFENLMSGIGEASQYIKYALIVGLLLSVSTPIVMLIKLANRKKTINQAIVLLDEGKAAKQVTRSTIYRITVPLLKINLHLYPVEYLIFYFQGSNQSFLLPVPALLIDDAKLLLSGGDFSQIEKIWNELYDEETTEHTQTDKLKSKDEFREFVKKDLVKDLEGVENERKGLKNSQIIAYVFAGLVFLGIMYFQFSNITGNGIQINPNIIYIVFGAVFVLSILFSLFMWIRSKSQANAYTDNKDFKLDIFKSIIQFVNPSFQHYAHSYISKAEIWNMSTFPDYVDFDVDGNDLIMGKHSGVPFQLSDIEMVEKQKLQSGEPDLVFKGQFFMAKFNKSFKNPVVILPKGRKTNSIDSLYIDLKSSNNKVRLEDPEFDKNYEVYAKDQIEARQILTTSFMERLKSLANERKGSFHFFFTNNRVYIANYSLKDSFESSMFKSYTANDYALIVDFYQDFCSQLKMIDELKLNENIWKM